MFIANYAKTVRKCNICSGKGCSFCQHRGMKEHIHLLIDTTNQFGQNELRVQQHLKDVQCEVL